MKFDSWIFMVFLHEWMGNIWKLNIRNKRRYVTTIDLSPCSPMTFPRLRTRRSLRPVSFWRGHLMMSRSWRLKHEIITLLGRHQSYFKYPTATSLWNKFESSLYFIHLLPEHSIRMGSSWAFTCPGWKTSSTAKALVACTVWDVCHRLFRRLFPDTPWELPYHAISH